MAGAGEVGAGPAWQRAVAWAAVAAAALWLLLSRSGNRAGAGQLQSAVLTSATAQRMQTTLEAVRQAKAAIYKTWDVDNFPYFLSMVDAPRTSWELQKQKFVELLLSHQGHGPGQTDGQQEHKRRFVIGFSGSSVTAGHDSFFNEAFPSVVNRTMRSVLAAAGVELEVRNHAFGNNPCCPYDNCLETHLGDDLDIVAWEQSMNCGRDPRPVETFIRAAARMSKRPSVWFITSGTPYWGPDDCGGGGGGSGGKITNSTTLTLIEGKGWVETKVTAAGPAQAPGTSAEEKALLSLVHPSAQAAAQSHLQNFTFLQIKTSTPGRVLNLAQLYSGVAPVGQNVQVIEKYRCLGPYGGDFSVKTPGGGQKWHPGKRGHQLRGDSLSFFLLSVLEDALSAVVALGEEELALSRARQVLGEEQAKVLSKPLICPAEECDSAPLCFTNYEPRMKNSLSDILLERPGAHNNWTLDLSFFDQAAVAKASARGLGYLDRKFLFTSGTMHKPLTMHISPRRDKSFLLVCEVQKGFNKYPAGMGDLDHAAALLLYENVTDSKGNRQHWTATSTATGGGTDDKKTRAAVVHLTLKPYADQCYRTESVIRPGNHILAVVQRHEGVRANIAYVVYW